MPTLVLRSSAVKNQTLVDHLNRLLQQTNDLRAYIAELRADMQFCSCNFESTSVLRLIADVDDVDETFRDLQDSMSITLCEVAQTLDAALPKVLDEQKPVDEVPQVEIPKVTVVQVESPAAPADKYSPEAISQKLFGDVKHSSGATPPQVGNVAPDVSAPPTKTTLQLKNMVDAIKNKKKNKDADGNGGAQGSGSL